MPGHKCEDTFLHYYKRVDGKQVEVQECDEEIVVTHNEDLDSEELSLAIISCDWKSHDENNNSSKDQEHKANAK